MGAAPPAVARAAPIAAPVRTFQSNITITITIIAATASTTIVIITLNVATAVIAERRVEGAGDVFPLTDAVEISAATEGAINNNAMT